MILITIHSVLSITSNRQLKHHRPQTPDVPHRSSPKKCRILWRRYFIIHIRLRTAYPSLFCVLQLFNTKAFKVFVCAVIKFWQSCLVFWKSFGVYTAITVRNANYYALSGPCQKNPVCIKHVFSIFWVVLWIPFVLSVELIESPLIVLESHIRIP